MVAKSRLTLKKMAYAGIMSAIMLIAQVAMAGLPNIELVSLLVMLYTLYDPKLTRVVIAVFVLAQGVIYGFGMWWLSYLYVWYLLHGLTLLTRPMASPVFNALLCGAFGLSFGSLTAIPYFIMGGVANGVAYIVAGIPFDLLHAGGNFVLTLLLFKPMMYFFTGFAKSHPVE